MRGCTVINKSCPEKEQGTKRGLYFFDFPTFKPFFARFFENTDFLEFPEIFSLNRTSEKHLESGKIEKLRPLLL